MIAELGGLTRVGIALSIDGDLDAEAFRQIVASELARGRLTVDSRGILHADGADLTIEIITAKRGESAALVISLDQMAQMYRDENLPCTAVTPVAFDLVEAEAGTLPVELAVVLRARIRRFVEAWEESNND